MSRFSILADIIKANKQAYLEALAKGSQPLLRAEEGALKPEAMLRYGARYGHEAPYHEPFKPRGNYWADDPVSAAKLVDPAYSENRYSDLSILRNFMRSNSRRQGFEFIRGAADPDARVLEIPEQELMDLYGTKYLQDPGARQYFTDAYKKFDGQATVKSPWSRDKLLNANLSLTDDLRKDYDFLRIPDADSQTYGVHSLPETIQINPEKTLAWYGPYMRKLALTGTLGGGAVAGMPDEAEAASPKQLLAKGLPIPKSWTDEGSAMDRITKYIREYGDPWVEKMVRTREEDQILYGDRKGTKRLDYLGSNTDINDGEYFLKHFQDKVLSEIEYNPQNPIQAIKDAIAHDTKYVSGISEEFVYKDVVKLMDPEILSRRMKPEAFKQLMDWAGVADNKNTLKGLTPILMGTGLISFMSPTGELQAMPVSKAIPYTVKTARSIMMRTFDQHDDAYRVIGNRIDLHLPTDSQRTRYEITDMLTNHKDAWNMVVKNSEGDQFAVPLTKEEFRAFMQASGTKDYLKRFKHRDSHGQLLQASKSLGIRETKRSADPKQLRKEIAALEERQIDLLKAIDPKLVSGYVFFKPKGTGGPSVYIPEPYARKLVEHGLGNITKIMKSSKEGLD